MQSALCAQLVREGVVGAGPHVQARVKVCPDEENTDLNITVLVVHLNCVWVHIISTSIHWQC